MAASNTSGTGHDDVLFTTAEMFSYHWEDTPQPGRPGPLLWAAVIVSGAVATALCAWTAWLLLFRVPGSTLPVVGFVTVVGLVGFGKVFERVTNPRRNAHKNRPTEYVDPVATAWTVCLVCVGVLPVVAALLWQLPVSGILTFAVVAANVGLALCCGAIATTKTLARIREGDRLRAQRENTKQVAGTVVSLELSEHDDEEDDVGLFDIVVRYQGARSSHDVDVELETPMAKVPQPGTPLWVTYVPERGEDKPVKVELDDTEPIQFDEHADRYRSAEG